MAAGAQVVQTLMVEMDGRTVQLEAKIAQMEARLKRFEQTTTQSTQNAGKVVGSLGDKYANAARAIANAGEQAARTGKLAGEAGKTLLNQGAGMALMFGPQGAIAGAVAITTLAVVEMFQRWRKEMRDTRNAWVTSLEDMARSGNVAQLSFERQRRFSGDPFAIRKDGESDGSFLARSRGWQGIRQRLPAIDQELEAINRGEKDNGLSGALAQSRRETLRAALREERKELLEHRRVLARELSEIAPIFDAAVAKSVEQATQGIKRDSEKKAVKSRADQERDAKQILSQVEDASATATGSAAEMAYRALERQNTAIREAIALNEALSAQQKQAAFASLEHSEAIQKQTLAVQRYAEDVDVVLTNADAGGATVENLLALNREQTRFLGLKERVAGNAAAEKVVNEVLLKIDAQRVKLVKELADRGAEEVRQSAKTQQSATERVKQLAREIGTAVEGASELAAAFGLVDANVGRILESVGQLTRNIPGALDFFKESTAKDDGLGATKTNATALLGAAGAVGTIASVAIAMFGESPAEKERRRLLEENSRAIRDLTDRVGLLGGVSISGSEIGAAGDVLEFYFRRLQSAEGWDVLNWGKDATKALSREQVDILVEAARDLNLEWDGTAAGLQNLQAALDAASGKLAEFGDDFGGTQGWLDFQRRIFGDKGAADNLGKVLGAFAGRSAGIGALAGFDTSTAEGREAMRRMIEQYAALMAAGGGTIGNDVLGDLSGDEFRDLLLEITGYLDDIEGRGGSDGTGGYNIDRSITQIEGSRISGLLTSANAYHMRTAAAVEAMAAGLGVIQAPGVGGNGMRPGGVVLTFGDIVVEVTGGAGDPDTLGERVGRTAAATILAIVERALRDPRSGSMDAIDASLSRRTRRRERGRGNNELT